MRVVSFTYNLCAYVHVCMCACVYDCVLSMLACACDDMHLACVVSSSSLGHTQAACHAHVSGTYRCDHRSGVDTRYVNVRHVSSYVRTCVIMSCHARAMIMMCCAVMCNACRYGSPPLRIDGYHCAHVGLSFRGGEKCGTCNHACVMLCCI